MKFPVGPVPRDLAGSPGPLVARPAAAPTGLREHRFVHAYAVFVMLLGTGAFAAVIEADVQAIVFAVWVLAYGVAALGLLDDRLRFRLPLRLPVALTLLVALALASTLWSAAPDITIRRAFGLAGTVLVGVFLGRRLSTLELLDALRRALLVVVVASLLLYASGSPLALDEVHGTLRGVLETKNTLGRFAALGILASTAVGMIDPRARRRSVLSTLLMLLALGLTASTGGSVMAALVVAGAATILVATHPRGRLAVAGLAALFLAALITFLPGTSAEEVTGSVGEDTTLTGRTDIWRLSLAALAARPLLGYGYGAFWNLESPPPEAMRIRGYLQWEVPNSHNGLLDVAIDLGVLGAVAAAAALIGLIVRGLGDLAAGRRPLAALRLSVAGVTIVSNLVETGLFQLNSLYTVLLVAAIAATPSRAAPASGVRDELPADAR